MTKRTPLERYEAWQQKSLLLGKAAIEAHYTEDEALVRVLSDASLSYKQRLARFKRFQAWPRIVLGLYEAELAVAQKNRQANGRPYEIARDKIEEAIDLKSDRIRDLCREGKRHLEQGMPSKPQKTAAEFKRELSTALSEDEAAKYRRIFAEKKKQAFANFEHRFLTLMRPLIKHPRG
jgi:hypothetical protein